MTIGRVRAALVFFAALLPTAAGFPAGNHETGDTLIDNLLHARAYKVRVSAANLLGRIEDPRTIDVLGQVVISDPNPVVRAFALRILAKNPAGQPDGGRARAAISVGLNDHAAIVKKSAAVSLKELGHNLAHMGAAAAGSARASARRRSMAISVRQMGDRTGHASAAVKARMRDEIIKQLRAQPHVTVADAPGAEPAFIIDGAIKKLILAQSRDGLEMTCAVELILSRPPHGLVLVASGEAAVQRPRSQYRPIHHSFMENEAMEHAVKSAQENLARFLAAQ